MRTTLNINDDLYRKIKSKAALEGKKITDLIHQGLLYVLDEGKSSKRKENKPRSLTYKPIDRSKGKKLFANLSTEEYIERLKRFESSITAVVSG